MDITSIKPAGYVESVRTLPSTLMRRCITIALVSRALRAYFSLEKKKALISPVLTEKMEVDGELQTDFG